MLHKNWLSFTIYTFKWKNGLLLFMLMSKSRTIILCLSLDCPRSLLLNIVCMKERFGVLCFSQRYLNTCFDVNQRKRYHLWYVKLWDLNTCFDVITSSYSGENLLDDFGIAGGCVSSQRIYCCAVLNKTRCVGHYPNHLLSIQIFVILNCFH